MGLLSKSAVMISQRPSRVCISCVSRRCNSPLWRSYRRPNIEGKFTAIWPLPINCNTHIGYLRFLFNEEAGVVNAPNNPIVSVSCVDVRELCRPWKVKFSPFRWTKVNRDRFDTYTT
jgi:hypothetical protein